MEVPIDLNLKVAFFRSRDVIEARKVILSPNPTVTRSEGPTECTINFNHKIPIEINSKVFKQSLASLPRGGAVVKARK